MKEFDNEILTQDMLLCKLCKSQGTFLFKNVTDKLFHAPGKWNIKKCSNPECGLLWLDPMPREEEIWKAYINYYTHTESNSNILKILRPFEKIYLSLFYGYYENTPFFKKLFGLILLAFPTEKINFDFSILWLKNNEKGKLLDIGCGNGLFIEKLHSLGWDTTGIDVDAKAIDYCKTKGLNVLNGNILDIKFSSESFDVITLNHVVEHLYDAELFIKECYRVLKKGGKIVIATPNSKSRLLKRYKESWFALQPPGHLFIYNIFNLSKLLEQNGFDIIKAKSTYRIDGWVHLASKYLKAKGYFEIGKKYPKTKHIFGKFVQLFILFLLPFNKNLGSEMFIKAKK